VPFLRLAHRLRAAPHPRSYPLVPWRSATRGKHWSRASATAGWHSPPSTATLFASPLPRPPPTASSESTGGQEEGSRRLQGSRPLRWRSMLAALLLSLIATLPRSASAGDEPARPRTETQWSKWFQAAELAVRVANAAQVWESRATYARTEAWARYALDQAQTQAGRVQNLDDQERVLWYSAPPERAALTGALRYEASLLSFEPQDRRSRS
jgi:hypothetical protein